jgi:nitroreductase/ferredoxin
MNKKHGRFTMALFRIDKRKCRRDGICVAECPVRIIELREDSPVPEPVEKAEDFCIRCGHCVAVCPHGAFSHSEIAVKDCAPVNKDLKLSARHAEHFLRSRRSIRTYKDKPIEREKLQRLIEVARYAPTGTNSQRVEWLVLNSRERVRKAAGMTADWMRHLIEEDHPVARGYRLKSIVSAWDAGVDFICRGAAGLIVAHAPVDYAAAQTDCTIAITFLDLAAPSFGLGTCWAGFFMFAAAQWPPLKKALNLPEGHACFGAMMIGYPKYTYRRLPPRREPAIKWME